MRSVVQVSYGLVAHRVEVGEESLNAATIGGPAAADGAGGWPRFPTPTPVASRTRNAPLASTGDLAGASGCGGSHVGAAARRNSLISEFIPEACP